MNDLMTKSLMSYVDLKKQALKDLETEPDLEMGRLGPTDEENLAQSKKKRITSLLCCCCLDKKEMVAKHLAQFKEEVSAIQQAEREDLLLHIQQLKEEAKITPRDMDLDTVLKKAKIFKSRLKALDESNVANRLLSKKYKEGSPVDSIRMSLANGLRIKPEELMNDFNQLREVIVLEHKEALKSWYLKATGEIPTKEMIESMMTLKGGQLGIFARDNEFSIINLERQLAELQKISTELELHHIQSQCELSVEMDDIHQYVGQASDMDDDIEQYMGQASDMDPLTGG